MRDSPPELSHESMITPSSENKSTLVTVSPVSENKSDGF